MLRLTSFVAATCCSLLLLGGELAAQSTISSAPEGAYLLDSYVAYIGPADLRNSAGVRLTEPWQIIRQDRANVHRFGRADPGDGWDTFFGDADNRAKMELMLRSGWIEPQAARNIVAGGALVLVEVYGRNGLGTSVNISVAR